VRAVVLVGGEGTRLRPLTLATPKQLLAVAERSMIERVLDQLANHGVDEAVLALGYRPDAFLEAFPSGRASGVRLVYAVEPAPLDTAGAVRFAATEAGIDETFLVVNGDVLADLDLGSLVEFHRWRGAEATIALTPVEDPSSFGVVPTDPDGRVLAFIEKPPPGHAPTNLINAGAYVLEPSVLGRIQAGRRVSIEREIFPARAAEGTLFAMVSGSYWVDAGTPANYLWANLWLVGSHRPPVSDARETAPGVWVVGMAVIDGEVAGSSLVGEAAFVGAGSVVTNSVVGAGARVESGASVTGSVLLAGAVVGQGSRVEGSILGEGAVVAPEAVVRALSVVGPGEVVAAGTTVDGLRIPA